MLNEDQHAFISADYYQKLLDALGPERADPIFVFATREYAHERGARMAQRALRDGKALDFNGYNRYGEWSPTAPGLNTVEITSLSPDYVMEVTDCVWQKRFAKMGRSGQLYCRYLDEGIARGFNPDLVFETRQSLSLGQDRCIFRMGDAKLSPEDFGEKNPGDVRSFTYHCGHLLHVFRRVLRNVMGPDEALTAAVLRDFGAEYGQEAAQELTQAAEDDFSRI